MQKQLELFPNKNIVSEKRDSGKQVDKHTEKKLMSEVCKRLRLKRK